MNQRALHKDRSESVWFSARTEAIRLNCGFVASKTLLRETDEETDCNSQIDNLLAVFFTL